jgi:hypothetical protein
MFDEQNDFLGFSISQTKHKVNVPASAIKDFDELRQSGERLLRNLNEAFNENLDYNSKSVDWLDQYISKIRDITPEECNKNLVGAIGYILGQSIIEKYGGKWRYFDEYHQWVVDVGEPVGVANPIGKVQKYFFDYLDSIGGFFEVIELVKQKGSWNIGRKGSEL